MARLPRPVTMMISARPDATASSTTYWIIGLSTSGSISLGWALVAGRKRVPRPAAGNTALRTIMGSSYSPAPSDHAVRDHPGGGAGDGADERGPDDERERHAAQERHRLAPRDPPRGGEQARDLGGVARRFARDQPGADPERRAVHERREPRQVEPRAGDGRGLVEAARGRDDARPEGLGPVR